LAEKSDEFNLGKWIEWALKHLLSDKNPPSCKPYNTYLLASVMTAIYIGTLVDVDWWISLFGLCPTILLNEPWRIFTYMWLHYPSVSVVDGFTIYHAHLAFNLLYLWVFGDNVECRIGYLKYVVFYVVCGIVAGLGQVIILNLMGFGSLPIIIVGSSGAISGIMGMYVVFFPENKVVCLGKETFAWYFVLLWVVGQFSMLASMNIFYAVGAHITGFLFGVIVAFYMRWFYEQKR